MGRLVSPCGLGWESALCVSCRRGQRSWLLRLFVTGAVQLVMADGSLLCLFSAGTVPQGSSGRFCSDGAK
jgi:hypothetical protein